MGWNFYNASGELQINDGGVQASAAVFTGNVDLGSNLLVGNAGSTGIAISSAGEVTMAAQPACLVVPSSEISNVTGDGTVYTIVYATEIFDQNADFATSTFTAPVTGRYMITYKLSVGGILVAMNNWQSRIVTSNRALNFYTNPWAIKHAVGPAVVAMGLLMDMDAADTCTITLTIDSSSKVADIQADSQLSIHLVA